jgi:hypothetical protein
MLDIKDFSVLKTASFDFKGLLIKKLLEMVLVSLLSPRLSGQYSQRKVYSMETLISVKEESNPLFTSNTSLVLTVELLTRFKLFRLRYSRGRITELVDKLQYYINYMVQGKYALEVCCSFYVEIDKSKGS